MLKFFSLIWLCCCLFFQPILLAETLPIGPNGKPDLNGVWQVMNRANYNLEAHSASAAMHLVEGPVVPIPHPDILALGAVGSVPAGLSVVEGGMIPYKKSALIKREENKKDWLNRDPEIKCYLPGVPRATYMPCLLYTSPSPRDISGSRMPSSA